MGRSEDAKSDFDNALTLDPSNAELRHAIEMEVAALPEQSPPLTAQDTPPQSPPEPSTKSPGKELERPALRNPGTSLSTQRAEREYDKYEARRAEEKRQRAESEKEFKRQQAEIEEARRAQAKLAKLPANRLKRAYYNYSMVQLCHQVREGYLAANINDIELQRARTASKAIENAAIAEDATINPDKMFAEADKQAKDELSQWTAYGKTSDPFRGCAEKHESC
jgi:hypothetical protein